MNRKNRDQSKALWNEYDDWHSRYDVDENPSTPWHGLVTRHLNTGIDLADRRVLEIGCGRGGFAMWLASRNPASKEIVAADFSEIAIEKGREGAKHRHLTSPIQWIRTDIHQLPFSDSSFDTVISCETVEHVSAPLTALRELRRVLRPGGRLFLTAPNYLGSYGLYRGYFRLRGRKFTEEGQPINQFTTVPRTYFWLRKAGFSIEHFAGRGHYVLFPGRAPFELTFLDRYQFVSRWFGFHSLFVATRQR